MGRPTGDAGSLIRIERQLHFAKPAQAPPEALDAGRLADLWVGELAPWTRSPRTSSWRGSRKPTKPCSRRREKGRSLPRKPSASPAT
jgi:hypothetical protein